MMQFFRTYLLLAVFFLFLTFCLFLGDGPQMLIDVVGAGGVVIIGFLVLVYRKKERELPRFPVLMCAGILLYFCIRTVFSDDIGFSVYTTVRMFDAFLIFYVMYCYSNDQERAALPSWLLGFSIISLAVSYVFIIFPILQSKLPNINLLTPMSGHNDIVDILIFGYPVALFTLIRKKNTIMSIAVFLFLLSGIFFSFARGVMGIVAVFTCIVLCFSWTYISRKKRVVLFSVFSLLCALVVSLFLLPKISFQQYFPSEFIPIAGKDTIRSNHRLDVWTEAVKAIKERPFFGSGPGTFILQAKRLQERPWTYCRYAHNALLEQLTEVGIVGTLLILILLFSIGTQLWHIYTYADKKNQYILLSLGSGLLLVMLNASIDYTMDYFIVLMLFMSVLGCMLSFGPSVRMISPAYTKLFLMISVVIMCVFYCVTSICALGIGKRIPFVSSCCFLSEFYSKEYLKNSEVAPSASTVSFIAQLHRKNSDVLEELGPNYIAEAAALVPLDYWTQKIYLQTLIQNKQYTEINLVLQRLYMSVLEKNSEKFNDDWFHEIDSLNPLITNAYNVVDVHVLDENIDSNVALAKYFYFLGYYILPKDPLITIRLWTLANRLALDWSYFSVELASLYYQQKDFRKALEVLIRCSDDVHANEHCKIISFSDLPSPGYFLDAISDIKKEGKVAIGMSIQNNYDQQKTLDILTLFMKNDEKMSVQDFLFSLSMRFLSEKEAQIIQKMNFSAPLLSNYLLKAISLLKNSVLITGDRLFLAKLYYLIGYEGLKLHKDMTENFWQLSYQLVPEWSYFSVELASLYHQEHDDTKALKILKECQNNLYAKNHCQMISNTSIPSPGYFKNDIMNIFRVD